MRHKENETKRERKKKGRDREKKIVAKRKKELDTCKARVAQLVSYINVQQEEQRFQAAGKEREKNWKNCRKKERKKERTDNRNPEQTAG